MESRGYEVWREALARLNTQLDKSTTDYEHAKITGLIACIIMLRDLTKRVEILETELGIAA